MSRINIENLEDTEADDLLGKLLDRRPLKEHLAAKEGRTQLVSLAETFEEAEDLVSHEGEIYGVTTGITGFDELTLGMKGGDLIVVAGQTSHGKSLLGLNIAYHMAREGKGVLFATLEMSKARTTSRILSMARQDGIKDTDVLRYPILYQEATALAYNDIGLLVKRAKDNGCKLAIIDHLHFFPRGAGNGNVSMEIGRITKHFKEVAVQHDIPVILISHVNRLSDPKSKPGLSNLKESGYIEQDADSVVFIWRDLSLDGDSSDVEIYIAKSRNDGFPNGRIKLFKQRGWHLDENRGFNLPPADHMKKNDQVTLPKDW